ncbi:Ethidium bromide-methyl viologen resistance protein EmrE [uncultured Gammaproteobacteria bacterium]|uniref:DMT family transporter n=1 Tax=Bathymodiolus heckerae thiotrophic gill symbiont TaxID=1052212 RepID=UPI001A24947E|nr:Ethidium bromide-methyl viologen resistance protein EmrE [uncultured Gammaproteobacteria bacterium]CAC9958409.1 Ethidium bromide-methyl viologen resistance protein EmrE [uncultured Gammaproteobacteria bacterium]
MKFSDGFSKLLPSILIFVCYALSFIALTFALKKFEMGIAYAIWAGLGIVLITAIGIIYFDESANLLKFGSILLIMIGIVGLHLSSTN